jgi:putative membrane protein
MIMMWEYGWGWPGLLMMTLSSLLWIAVIVALIWGVVLWVNKKQTNTTSPSALEILRQRYARGEIDTESFEQMRERLESFREQEGSS